MKRCLTILTLFVVATSLSAQWRPGRTIYKPSLHNLTFALEGGTGGLLMDGSFTKPTQIGISAGGNVGYTYMFNATTGFHTGLGFNYITSGYTSPSTSSVSTISDVDTWDNSRHYIGPGDIEANTAHVEENYSTMMVDIPLQVAYAEGAVWFNAGVRLSIPLTTSATFNYGATSLGLQHAHTTDTYFSPALPMDETLSAQSGKYTAHSISKKFALLATLAVEGGYRIPMKNRASVYVGLFADYSINKAALDEQKPFVDYNGETAQFNGMMRSSSSSGYRHFQTGIKAYYNIGFGPRIR